MRVITWNIRYFSHAVGGVTSLDTTIRSVAKALASLQPQADVVALQEIDTVSLRAVGGRYHHRKRRGEAISNFDRFVAHLNSEISANGGTKYQARFFPAQGHSKEFPLYSTGLALLFKEDIACISHNSQNPHEITHRRIKRLARFKQKRICAWARLKPPNGEKFDIFNTHLSLPAFLRPGRGPTGWGFGEADNQLIEADNVLNFIAKTGDLNRSLLVGDFNAVPGSRVYNRLTKTLIDAHADHLGRPGHELQTFPTGGFWKFRYRLDHIFRGVNLSTTDFKGTYPLDKYHPWKGLSDHTPLIAGISG
jgi:endonuclease/exonuclease/phosphatase family metal-dependent hydrolase